MDREMKNKDEEKAENSSEREKQEKRADTKKAEKMEERKEAEENSAIEDGAVGSRTATLEEEYEGFDEETVKDYKKAGAIHSKISKKWRAKIKAGMKLLEIADGIEKDIKDEGANLGFPVNLSKNNFAAHYTPSIDDKTTVGEKDLLKVDFGVHVNGFIADSAFTLDFSGENGKLIEASNEALQNALSVLKPGIEVRMIGKEIQETIEKHGFKPVHNLSGHVLGQYFVHAGLSIPNNDNGDTRILDEDLAFAVEPFASTGKGFVKEGAQLEIFQFVQPRPIRNSDARKIIERVAETYQTLPFSERAVASDIPPLRRKMAFKELLQKEILKGYPVLKEDSGVLISQSETTVLLVNGEFIITVEV